MFKLNIIDESKPASHLNLDYLSKYGNGKVFIETGTYLGDTVKLAVDAGFDNIHSIELDESLYSDASIIFQDNTKVRLWQGDSIDCLKEIFKILPDEPVTLWLDAHASGELLGGKSGGSPVIDELNIILKHGRKDNTIFIDDKRLFGSEEWSFVKEEDAIRLLKEINPNYNIHYLDGHIPGDVICATVK